VGLWSNGVQGTARPTWSPPGGALHGWGAVKRNLQLPFWQVCFKVKKPRARQRGRTKMTDTIQFEQFMLNYQNMVFTTAVRLLANEAEAKDVSQEVFIKAYERFAELSVSPTAGGWLRTVTTNLCINHLTRYRNRWKFFSELFANRESDDDELPYDVPIADNSGELMNEADQRRILEEALLKLPPAQRIPLVLYHFESKSYEETRRQPENFIEQS
jgi:RNA polymerase sigma-70 factor (ECF subfamily)